MKPKVLEGVSRWEVVGISAYPIVEAVLAFDLPEKLGWSTEQFFSFLAALMTVFAIVRAMRDNTIAKVESAKAEAATPAPKASETFPETPTED